VTSPAAVVLAQISDAHLRVGRDDGASARALEVAVRSLVALDPAPHAVLVSGDLADSGSAGEYERARELLAPLPVPVHVVAGNHDDRDALRAYFGAPAAGGGAGTFLQYATHIGPLRLVVCDTMLPGRNEGSFGPDRIGWLEAELAADRETPTIVAMHHPPLMTGIRVVDEIGLPTADQRSLAELLARNPQVRRIVAGHVHRMIAGALGGCGVFVCPSSYLQLQLAPSFADRIVVVREPAGFALHVAFGGEVTSHLQPIGDYEEVGDLSG
jgi:Icc protein